MKNKGLILSIILLIILLIVGGFLAYGYYHKVTFKLQRPVVSMEIKDYGTIKIELYPDMAPNTVKNFIKLVNEGYYNGSTFDRVEDMLIQGGEKDETKELSINGEFEQNGYDNTLKFERGTLGLAREDYTNYANMLTEPDLVNKGYNSGYDEFFIIAEDVPYFEGYYTAFGRVVEGMEIVDKIKGLETELEVDEETGETSTTTKPVNPPIIENVTVDTFGTYYGEPETHERFDVYKYVIQKLYGIEY